MIVAYFNILTLNFHHFNQLVAVWGVVCKKQIDDEESKVWNVLNFVHLSELCVERVDRWKAKNRT